MAGTTSTGEPSYVVDATAGDEAQHRLVLVRLQISVDVFRDELVYDVDWLVCVGGSGHQKYPCRFFTSMPAPPASLSMARPWRSDVRASSVSWMTSGSVDASLSTAPVSG